MDFNKSNAMTLEKAAKAIISVIQEDDKAVDATKELAIYERYKSEMDELKGMIQEQREVIDKQNEFANFFLTYIPINIFLLLGPQFSPIKPDIPSKLTKHGSTVYITPCIALTLKVITNLIFE